MKFTRERIMPISIRSPSIRREWIEMYTKNINRQSNRQSPSIRREWIEISNHSPNVWEFPSPSIRREWIEISSIRNLLRKIGGLPPYGGSGLK